jgi:hypothetical protein
MPKQHNNKEIKELFKELERLGFTIQTKKTGYTIIPKNKNQPKYHTHGTQSALHPIKRDLKKLYNITL